MWHGGGGSSHIALNVVSHGGHVDWVLGSVLREADGHDMGSLLDLGRRHRQLLVGGSTSRGGSHSHKDKGSSHVYLQYLRGVQCVLPHQLKDQLPEIQRHLSPSLCDRPVFKGQTHK